MGMKLSSSLLSLMTFIGGGGGILRQCPGVIPYSASQIGGSIRGPKGLILRSSRIPRLVLGGYGRCQGLYLERPFGTGLCPTCAHPNSCTISQPPWYLFLFVLGYIKHVKDSCLYAQGTLCGAQNGNHYICV